VWNCTANSDVKSSRRIAIANLNPNSECSKPRTHASRVQFQFVDEQERQRNFKSHFWIVVRFNAKMHSLSTRRAFNTRLVHLRRLEKAEELRPIHSSREDRLKGASCSTDPGSSRGDLGVHHSLSVVTMRNGIWEISNFCHLVSPSRPRIEHLAHTWKVSDYQTSTSPKGRHIVGVKLKC
jgi:hypothetical protein